MAGRPDYSLLNRRAEDFQPTAESNQHVAHTRTRAVRSLGEEAEKASSWMWHLCDIKERKSHDTQKET